MIFSEFFLQLDVAENGDAPGLNYRDFNYPNSLRAESEPAVVHAAAADLHTRVSRMNVNCRVTNVIGSEMPDPNSDGP